ncbi:FAD-dependent monooxygenase [Kribbella kalugense]|uniref:2-polyprenyl-6-methoxyphenol hydroxylase-like FAD-dependent oxidoreductase n=1 Tax=Kribbella kalugense TaxID=2512221 RepID=A0A4R7ZP76_9ACTN|nr:FAD-dependent monooxygenase [Kribbella kalugense]TDW18511.1 2-polyprenyl-6-methoxyphenol hydroxylase-like FAD-dependent oxidoreductase [Kribbella kalugense]
MNDVLVVGAGPTGLLLATELVLAGANVVLVDRAAERSGQSKALSLQPRSVEILHSRGLLGPLLEHAPRLPAGHFAGLPVPLDYTALDTRFPYQLGIPQLRIEQELEDQLAAEGVVLRRGLELTGLRQDEAGVVAAFADGTTIPAGWIVGCDGARSAVRKLAGIDFPGRDGRFSAVVADVVISGIEPDWALPSLVPRDGAVMTMVPLEDGVHRALFTGPEQQNLPKDQPVTPAEVASALQAWYGEDVVLRELRYGSRFTDAARQADRYRVGRVFVAGDAAHVHSPTGGQGMNLGLQDAFNLGWKLGAVVRGEAGEDLLDSYHDERHPAGVAVLANTRAQGVLMVPDDDVACLRETFVDLLGVPEANRRLAGVISGVGLAYAAGEHPLVGRRMPDLTLPDGTTVAERLRGGRHVLLDSAVDGELPAARILVRPDGYVRWATDDAESEVPEFPGVRVTMGQLSR